MQNRRVLISGASIAGPALAYWLSRYGFQVMVLEKAEELRPGGQAVDFKGPVHMRVLREMGVLDAIKAATLPTPANAPIVNAKGKRVGTAPGAFGSGDLEIPRGDLSTMLYERTKDSCEYIFGDSISSITEDSDGAHVTFLRGQPRTFDLVIGADGMHSNVRKLVFGPESDYVTHLGYYYGLAYLDGLGDEDAIYSELGRSVILGGLKADALFVFASPPLPPARDNVALQRQQLSEAFTGAGWKIPRLLAQLPEADDFYIDSISRAQVPTYAKGRVAIIGDAAWGNALGGSGTGLAVVGAYVLAGELAMANGDYTRAYRAYEERYRGYTTVAKAVNAGKLLAPTGKFAYRARNALFTFASHATWLLKLVDRFSASANLSLPDYSSHLVAENAIAR